MGKNGFTLVEMIATFAIIGLLLLITIPVTQRLTSNNQKDKYMLYVETVEKAVYTYADLQASNGVGQRVTISELINGDYVSEFSENGVSVDISTTITFSKENGKVTISPIEIVFGDKTCSKLACS